MSRRRALAAMTVVLLAACSDAGTDAPGQVITIADLTGLSEGYAQRLVDDLDLDVQLETIAASGASRFARNVVLRQDPAAGTKVPAGSTLTLYVPEDRPLRPQEKELRLLTHCGLSLPLRFDGRTWLPVDPKLRATVNPPDGFASRGFYDHGTIRRVDRDTLVYTSSTGVEVAYEPVARPPGSCE